MGGTKTIILKTKSKRKASSPKTHFLFIQWVNKDGKTKKVCSAKMRRYDTANPHGVTGVPDRIPSPQKISWPILTFSFKNFDVSPKFPDIFSSPPEPFEFFDVAQQTTAIKKFKNKNCRMYRTISFGAFAAFHPPSHL